MMIIFWILMIVSAIWMFLNRNMITGWLLEIVLAGSFLVFRDSLFKGITGILVFLVLYFWIMHVTAPVKKLKPAEEGRMNETGIIQVKQGKITGVVSKDQKTEIYAGIPYAKPPVDNLRWKEPQDPDPWLDVKKCDHFKPMAMQKETSVVMSSFLDIFMYKNLYRIRHERYKPVMSEDCLYLNIWKPAGKCENCPVVFYIHGGSLVSGQSWWDDYDGKEYAENGVIFITFTYRLGIFGFYADKDLQEESINHTTGMYGFLDQIKALQWVKDNISSFGGDPDNITIAGESAGSSSVNAMCVSPLTKGLFQKAIGESSSISARIPAHSYISLEDALKQGEVFRKEHNASDIETLRKMPVSELMQTKTSYETLCAFTDDGYALTESPYESYQKGIHNEYALLNGYNAKDGDVFTVLSGKVNLSNYREKLHQLLNSDIDTFVDKEPETDKEADTLYKRIANAYLFGYGHYAWSSLASAYEPVYLYLFSKDNKTISCNHTGELYYCYGSYKHNASKYTEEDRQLSDTMEQYWLTFIKTGNPNKKGLPEWKTFTPDTVMKFDSDVQMITNPDYKVLDKIQTLSDD